MIDAQPTTCPSTTTTKIGCRASCDRNHCKRSPAPFGSVSNVAVVVRIAGDGWLDDDDPLTDEQKALLEARIETHERDPEAAIPWAEFDARLKRRLGE